MILLLYDEFDPNLALNESPLSAYYLACLLMLGWDSLPCKLSWAAGLVLWLIRRGSQL